MPDRYPKIKTDFTQQQLEQMFGAPSAPSELPLPEPQGQRERSGLATCSNPALNRNLWLSLQQLANDEDENAKRTSDAYRKGWHAGMACAYRNASVLYDVHRQAEESSVRQPESNAEMSHEPERRKETWTT